MEKTADRAVEAVAKRALWSRRIGQWKGSGLTQRAFCAKRGLALSTFQWWRRRLADADGRPSHAVFLPLPVNSGPASVSGASVVEVELRSGTRLRFEGEAAQLAVRSLVSRVR
jgi:hypothetical protein